MVLLWLLFIWSVAPCSTQHWQTLGGVPTHQKSAHRSWNLISWPMSTWNITFWSWCLPFSVGCFRSNFPGIFLDRKFVWQVRSYLFFGSCYHESWYRTFCSTLTLSYSRWAHKRPVIFLKKNHVWGQDLRFFGSTAQLRQAGEAELESPMPQGWKNLWLTCDDFLGISRGTSVDLGKILTWDVLDMFW